MSEPKENPWVHKLRPRQRVQLTFEYRMDDRYHYAAAEGSTGVIITRVTRHKTKFREGGIFLFIKWDKSAATRGQTNGGYPTELFKPYDRSKDISRFLNLELD